MEMASFVSFQQRINADLDKQQNTNVGSSEENPEAVWCLSFDH
jgi:hypothetical protein